MPRQTDSDKRNPDPNYRVPPGWKFEEEWKSSAWNRRMAKHFAALAAEREAIGFVICPKCDVEHNGKTLTCRYCGHRAGDDD